MDPSTMLSRPGQNSEEGVIVTPDVGVLIVTPVADDMDSMRARSRLIRGNEFGRELMADASKAPCDDEALVAALLDAAEADMLRFSGIGQ